MTTERLTRAESKERTRRLLMDTARALFMSNGITNTTLESIAETAGLTRGAIYAHFDDKNHLVAELIASTGAIDPAFFAGFLDGSRPVDERMEAFESAAMALFGADEKQGALHAELIAYALRDRAIRDEAAGAYRRSDHALAGALTGKLKAEMTPYDVIAILHAVRDGLAIHRLVDPESYPDHLVRTALNAIGRQLLEDR